MGVVSDRMGNARLLIWFFFIIAATFPQRTISGDISTQMGQMRDHVSLEVLAEKIPIK